MRILHLIRKPNDSYALEIVGEHFRAPGATVEVVFLQDAVYRPLPTKATAYVLEEDCLARGVSSPLQRLSYEELIGLMFQSDRVISW